MIAIWGQGPVSRILDSLGEFPMLGIRTEADVPRHRARPGDAFLAEINQAVAARGELVYLRPMPEMNGHWNEYCAYNQDGSSRGPAHSTAAFRKAFARIYLLVHGGPLERVNAGCGGSACRRPRGRLAANPVSARTRRLESQGYGSPDVPGNSAAAYYPGDAYVDVVANDLYNIRRQRCLGRRTTALRRPSDKPYAIAEWANWGFDDPAFVARMADFVRTHRRVELLAYYNGRPGSPWDIATQPRSRAAYRRLIVPSAASGRSGLSMPS